MVQRAKSPGRHKLRPYLSSEEVLALTGANRRLLTTVIERGICIPHRDELTGSFGWTNGQVELIRQFHKLRSLGIPIDEIAQIVKEGGSVLENAVYETTAELSRTQRRSMKRTMLRSSAIASSKLIGMQEGYYIRYLPQRWMALIPQPPLDSKQQNAYLSAHMELSDIIDRVGWAGSGMSGTLLSAPSPNSSSRFAFIELVSQPQPVPSYDTSADSGCYRCLDSTAACAHSDREASCSMCARFGRAVGAGDLLRWEQFVNSNTCEDCTVMLDKLERPYASGPWSRTTLEALSRPDAPAMEPETDEVLRDLLAVRPRLMPHAVRLPMGVTACVMPAGMYLCCQCETSQQNRTLGEMTSVTRVIPHHDISTTEEVERSKVLCNRLRNQRDWRRTDQLDECKDMVSGMVQVGDLAQMEWWRPINDSELSKLVIPTATSLIPDSDYTIVCVNVPADDPNELHHLELQILVDTDGIVLGKSNRSRAKRSLGIIRKIASVKLESGEPAAIRCRFCGEDVPVPEGKRVVVCSSCGHMQVAPAIDSLHSAHAHRLADNLREAGDYDEAARIYRHMVEDGSSDVEVRWMQMVCRYGIHYEQNRENGFFEPVVSRPSEVPIRKDPDCIAALEGASDDEWYAYSRQLDIIEAARSTALNEQPIEIVSCTLVEDSAEDTGSGAGISSNDTEARTT